MTDSFGGVLIGAKPGSCAVCIVEIMTKPQFPNTNFGKKIIIYFLGEMFANCG